MTVDPNSEHWDIPVEELEWRIQHAKEGKDKALYVPYPNARTVAKHLDLIFGWDGWSDSYEIVESSKVKEVGIVCTLTVVTETGHETVKTGFGTATDIEAWKGGESDAFKRAAAKLGVGRNVYDLEMVWARVDWSNGRAYKPRGIEPELARIALGQKPSQPPAATTPPKPEPKVEYEVSDKQWKMYVDLMGALDSDGKKLIVEWWGVHGDGKKPERDMKAKVFTELLQRVQVQALGGEEVSTSAGGQEFPPEEGMPW